MWIFLWKETRLRELMSSPGAPSYSAGHSTPPSYSSGPSTPPSYSSGPSTPTNYSLGSSRNRECSNCKHLRGKISVLKATMEMHMHPEQHTVNSAALFHEVLNEMEKLDLFNIVSDLVEEDKCTSSFTYRALQRSADVAKTMEMAQMRAERRRKAKADKLDSADITFSQISTQNSVKANMHRGPLWNSSTFNIGLNAGSKSTPLSAMNNTDPGEKFRQMKQSSVRRLDTYVLLTPLQKATRLGTQRPSTTNMWHSAPLELPKRSNDMPFLVRRKMSECPRTLSDQTKEKIRITITRQWREHQKRKRLSEIFISKWAVCIATSAKKGGHGQQELEWDNYEKMEREIALQKLQQSADVAKAKEMAQMQRDDEKQKIHFGLPICAIGLLFLGGVEVLQITWSSFGESSNSRICTLMAAKRLNEPDDRAEWPAERQRAGIPIQVAAGTVFSYDKVFVSPDPDGEMYYGQLQEIIEFKYLLFKVALFRVKWFDTSNKGREAFKDDQYILVTQVKQVFYLEDKTKPHWKVVEHVNHKKFSDGGVIVVEDDPDIIHFDNSYDLPFSTSLNDLNNATLHIDGQSTVVDAPPDIIDVLNVDDDIIGDEDALPHDLADSDAEYLINVDDDG
ncbi:hypothetical protein Tco_0134173, partial [Tanacetum coccineum]